MAEAPRDQNHVPTALFESSSTPGLTISGKINQVTGRILVDSGSAGGGTVTTVSVVTANGFAGSVANATTTPAITLSTTVTGVLKGNGTAISAAVANTDYQSPVTLTTTGTSGAATFNGTTLNVPVYSSNVPTTITVANEATDTTCFPAFFTAATGDLGPKTNANLTFNSNTGLLGSTALQVTGNVVPANGAYLLTTNTLAFAVNSTGEVQLTATSLSPITNDGNALGTSSLSWADLFGATGFTFNFNSGNVILTHSSGILTLDPGDLRIASLNVGTNADSVSTLSSTSTLTNKRITQRVTTITSSATPTVNTDTCDAVTITALAATITSMTSGLSGTPTNFQKLIYRIKDNGTARGITWGASFAAMGVALPTTTVISKVLTVGFIWDSVASVWGCVASAQEA